MSELTGKELERKMLEEAGRERTPEEKLVDKVEYHLVDADLSLQAVLDVAERGREEMEAGVCDYGARFGVILELLEQYRERHIAFIESLYPKMAA